MPLATDAAYEGDFYTWAQQQGALLRTGRLDEIDRDNIAEEIESLAREEFRKLVGFYGAIMLLMLKWEHQPNLRSGALACKIEIQRIYVQHLLQDSPGLSSRMQDALDRAYRTARLEALVEAGFRKSTFPEVCPYTLDDLLERPFPVE